MKRLQPLDIVRTAYGTVCVVNEVSSDGSVSLVLPAGSSQKYAWYKPSELAYVGSVAGVCSRIPDLNQDRPAREKLNYPSVLDDIYDSINSNV